MKKIIGTVAAAMLVLLMAGCATGNAVKTSAADQNEANNLPKWCDVGSFTSEDVKAMPEGKRIWEGYVSESGLFFTGYSNLGDRRTATSTAELNAKAGVAQYVNQAIIDYQKNNRSTAGDSSTESYNAETGSVVARRVSGIRRVDRFNADDGYTYVLMFVSNSDINKAAKDSSLSDYEKRLVETVFPVTPNKE